MRTHEPPIGSGDVQPARRPPAGSTAGWSMPLLQLQHMAGNGAVAGALATTRPRSGPLVVQRSEGLHEQYGDNYGQAVSAVVDLWGSTGGVVTRQRDAVRAFTGPGGAGGEQELPLSEQLLLGALEFVLGAALKGIGKLVTQGVASVASRVARVPVLAGAIAGSTAGSVTVEDIVAIGEAAEASIGAAVEAGAEQVTSSVRSSWSRVSSTTAGSLAQFGETQLAALNAIGVSQSQRLRRQLANLPEAVRWGAAQTVHDLLEGALDRVYDEQWNTMTDTWFSLQTKSVGIGARPGVLQIELENAYAGGSGYSVSSANLLGAGSTEPVRQVLGRRTIGSIGIPRVIRMPSGSLGWGWLDHDWQLHVFGAEGASAGPELRAPVNPDAPFLTDRPGTVQRISGNRWGPTWLAAHALGLTDLDREDPRVTSDAIWRGAEAMWAVVRNLTPGSIGNSSW